MDAKESRPEFVSVKRVITLVNLAGSTKAFQSKSDVGMAALFQQYYKDCETVLTAKNGTVIKFMGDACLATFPPCLAQNAVDAVLELQAKVVALSKLQSLSLELGANLHMALTVEVEFSKGTNHGKDIIGRGVNQTFLLGRGAGIRISEPVYRRLASSARSDWRKYSPPAVYHLDDRSSGIYEGMSKEQATNAERW